MPDELRMRVFAGPNGSGKSTIIKSIREYLVDGRALDFGIYINADDIANQLRNGVFNLTDYEVTSSTKVFNNIALASGLVNESFPKDIFLASFIMDQGKIALVNSEADERLAQIIADFLRKTLLSQKRKFSFETVFSHPSKLEIMRQANEAGYKVYLYFVSTENPEFNKSRVAIRVQENGHNVFHKKNREPLLSLTRATS